MNQSTLSIIVLVSVVSAVVIAFAVVRSNPPSANNNVRANTNNTAITSTEQITTDAVPTPEKPLFNGQFIEGTSIMLPWTEANAPFIVSAKDLPLKSGYMVEISSAHDFTVRFFPNIGEHYLLEPYSVAIIVAVHRSDLTPTAVSCTIPVGYEDLRPETWHDGNYEITVDNRLVRYPVTVEGGNPNPYTPELVTLLLRTLRGLRIGNCK